MSKLITKLIVRYFVYIEISLKIRKGQWTKLYFLLVNSRITGGVGVRGLRIKSKGVEEGNENKKREPYRFSFK